MDAQAVVLEVLKAIEAKLAMLEQSMTKQFADVQARLMTMEVASASKWVAQSADGCIEC
jgi:hypothetical protein